jgi:hypothetical protein
MSRPASRIVDTLTAQTRPPPKDLPTFVSNIAAKHGKVPGESDEAGASPKPTGQDDAVLEAHRKALEERQNRMMERLQHRQAQSPPDPGNSSSRRDV